ADCPRVGHRRRQSGDSQCRLPPISERFERPGKGATARWRPSGHPGLARGIYVGLIRRRSSCAKVAGRYADLAATAATIAVTRLLGVEPGVISGVGSAWLSSPLSLASVPPDKGESPPQREELWPARDHLGRHTRS